MAGIDAFQAALNNLVENTGRSRRNYGRARARRNMAIEKYGARFETPAELVEYERMMGLAALPAPGMPVPTGLTRATAPKPVPKAPRVRKGELRDPEGPPSFGQAKSIGVSIGGLASYCPQLVGQQIPGGAHVVALHRMGLTKAKASAVIDAMQRAGVLYGRTSQQQAVARQILAEVGGVVCPT